MNRRLAFVCLLASVLGCDVQSNSGKKSSPPAAKQTQGDEKTTDDARKYLQEQIDQYLGGQRTLAQLNKTGAVSLRHAGQAVHSITITNVLPRYEKDGSKTRNWFMVPLVVTGDGWVENMDILLAYDPDKGQWLAAEHNSGP